MHYPPATFLCVTQLCHRQLQLHAWKAMVLRLTELVLLILMLLAVMHNSPYSKYSPYSKVFAAYPSWPCMSSQQPANCTSDSSVVHCNTHNGRERPWGCVASND